MTEGGIASPAMSTLSLFPPRGERRSPKPTSRTARKPSGNGPDEPVYRVGQLNRVVKLQLEDHFRNVWIQGELSDVSRPASGHVYFTLCDEEENAQIRGVIFRSDAARAKAKLENGALVKLRGTVSLFEPRGSYQLIARLALPLGLGDLHAQFELVRKRLEADGLLDADRKRPLPQVPQVVGVVTSGTGAALHDIIVVAQERCPTRIVLSPCLVQGAGAKASIIAALKSVQKMEGLSVVIIGRGGGAAEDLVAFNDEEVARAVAACRVPTVSAVGHEVDISICDLVADVRAATPSNAAELVVPARETLQAEVEAKQARLVHAMTMALSHRRLQLDRQSGKLRDPSALFAVARQRIDTLAARLEGRTGSRVAAERGRIATLLALVQRQDPRLQTERKRGALQHHQDRLRSITQQRLAAHRARLAQLAGRLSNLSPLSVLGRGYAIALHDPTGQALLNAQDAKPGDMLTLRLHNGNLKARVQS